MFTFAIRLVHPMNFVRTIILFVCCHSVYGQNLVPNGDFEDYNFCPEFQANLFDELYGGSGRSVKNWFDPTHNTSDYFNACSLNPMLTGVPGNALGNTPAKSGNGYCGFGVVNNLVFPWFEYIEVRLSEKLMADSTYCCSYWLISGKNTCFASNNVGMVISVDSLYAMPNMMLTHPTAFVNNQVHTESEVWTEFQFNYVAQGGEEYISFGVFDLNNFQQTQFCNNDEFNFSYYFIDDVSIYLDSCGHVDDTIVPPPPPPSNDTITEQEGETLIPNVFTPNHDGINDYWGFEWSEDCEVRVLNRWGEVVYFSDDKNPKWDGENSEDGVYFYTLESAKHVLHGFITLQR